MNGGEIIASVLEKHGVRFLFTLCGGHISPILVEAKRKGIRVVDTRHEVTAVFAADAVARLTGVPGVAAVTAGPGVTNTITAIKNAQLAQSPVVLLGGATATVLKGRGALQDIDQVSLFTPHVKACFSARRVRDLAPMLTRALALSRSGIPGPVFLECPVDLLYDQSIVRQWYGAKGASGRTISDHLLATWLQIHTNRIFAGSSDIEIPDPPPRTVETIPAGKIHHAATRLRTAERPLAIIGSQAVSDATLADATAAAVERLGIPVYLSGMARGLLGPDNPLQSRHARREALREADVVLLAGVPADFRLDYGRHLRRATYVIGVNQSSRDLVRNRRPALGVVGDPGSFLRALAEALEMPRESWREWRARLAERDAAREESIVSESAADDDGINPLAVTRAIEAAIAPDSVLVADGGDFVATASYVVHPRGPVSWLDPGPFGTLGVGAGFALGAKLVRPSAEVWILYGDGSVGYSLTEFDTFVRHGVPVIAVVGNDACWTQIAREQIEILGDDVGCALKRTDYHKVVEGFGADGIVVTKREELAPALSRAKELAGAGHPVLVNVHLGKTTFRKGSISI